MKTMKAICTAAILALALSVPAYAGDMLTPGANPPPPPPPELHITGDISAPAPTPFPLGDINVPINAPSLISTTGFTDILWILASIF